MQIQINKEISDYQENMYFGLSARQFFFSVVAVGVAVGLYFGLKPVLGMETVSWVCILGAFPFAAMGFVRYHGMTAEQLLWEYIRSELLEPKQLHYETGNFYYRNMKKTIESNSKEAKKNNDKDTAECNKD